MNVWDGIIPIEEQENYRSAGFGRRSRVGRRPALLIVDCAQESAAAAAGGITCFIPYLMATVPFARYLTRLWPSPGKCANRLRLPLHHFDRTPVGRTGPLRWRIRCPQLQGFHEQPWR